jgi:hypothetical protein
MHDRERCISGAHFTRVLPPIIFALLSACGDPAPGEGMGQAPMPDPMPELLGAREAVQLPDIPTIDPQTLEAAEVRKVLGTRSYCSFSYTAESPPVVAFSEPGQIKTTDKGLVKIHGRLVALSAQSVKPGIIYLTAEGMKLEVSIAEPPGQGDANTVQHREADMHFELEQGLRIGYRGWYSCTATTVPR